MEHVKDVVGHEMFAKIEPIKRGWSSDNKYRIETTTGDRLILRISDIAEYDRKKAEYEMVCRAYNTGVHAPRPVRFGLCDEGKKVYSLSGWIDGEDAEKALPLMNEADQYAFGEKAGMMLRKIHSLPAPPDAQPWDIRFRRKVQERIDFYHDNSIQTEGSTIIVRHLQAHQGLLIGRPQTFSHGDFGTSNIIVTPDGQAGIIDFNAFNSDHGDPWWDFDSIPWGTEPIACYTTGLIKGYFASDPPGDFFEILAYYLAYDALAALCDTSKNEQGEPEDGRRHVRNVLRWFDDMKNTVPTWYLKS